MNRMTNFIKKNANSKSKNGKQKIHGKLKQCSKERNKIIYYNKNLTKSNMCIICTCELKLQVELKGIMNQIKVKMNPSKCNNHREMKNFF